MSKPRSESNKGLIYAFTAYTIWGIVPLYWPKLQPAGPIEILAHRFLWSAVVLYLFLLFTKRVKKALLIFKDSKKLQMLALASLLVGVNWGIFIWASVSGRILDSSLGYYINPLFSIGLGVVLLKEKLRKLQWLAIAIATVAILWLTVTLGAPPYVALSLAVTFGFYGYIKKKANVEAIDSLFVETILATPFALGYLAYLNSNGQNSFGAHGISHAIWLASAGIITAVPLAMFGAAAIRIPLSTLGFIQYIGPTLQYIVGLYAFNEPMSHNRFIGFVLTWIAIAIISYDALKHRKSVTKEYVPDLD
ncbi:MAG: EamA family transporter RarD [Actinomycetota bacterium]